MRAFIALSGMKPLGEKLGDLGDMSWSDPLGTIGVLADYVGGRIKREVAPDSVTLAHPELRPLADPLSDQVKRLRSLSESLLRKHKRDIM